MLTVIKIPKLSVAECLKVTLMHAHVIPDDHMNRWSCRSSSLGPSHNPFKIQIVYSPNGQPLNDDAEVPGHPFQNLGDLEP